ncbi:MAG: hypothetical protein R3251_04280 [Candidatus Spechtbacterales bacterium]|nr:hypothetical protein [Candidatus Spechtbacterales bacterium]
MGPENFEQFKKEHEAEIEEVNDKGEDTIKEYAEEGIDKLEELELLSDNDKTDILLIWRGLKQATGFEYGYSWKPGEEEKHLADEELNKLKQTIEDMGLYIKEGEREQQEAAEEVPEGEVTRTYAGYDKVWIYIGRDKESAEQWENADHIKTPDTLGALSGYPQSAIDAYEEATKEVPYGEKLKEMVYSDELPEEIKEEDFAAFVQFFLSRDNWQEEIETVKKWAQEIKRTDPALYERIVENYKNRLR